MRTLSSRNFHSLWRTFLSGGRARWAGVVVACAWAATLAGQVPLDNYDTAIQLDALRGITPVQTLTTPVVLAGTGPAAPFDFGPISGPATFEFILEADPSFNNSAFLAVGSNTASSLRYEVWDNTGEIGFTQAGVADYQFTPGVASPSLPTHIVYQWDPATSNMVAFVNGKLAGQAGGVDGAFVMPGGPGLLGSNPDGDERMVGTIYRITIYDSLLDAATILHHSDAFGGDVLPALAGYDAAVAVDEAGGLVPAARLDTTVVLPATGTTPFNFGDTTGDVTMEFILKGDPSVNNSAFLAVGANSASSLRYELWNDTGALGFTQAGAADYPFSPGAPSPLQPTHVTYAWSSATASMKLYLNGVPVGSASGVDAGFAMPNGQGYLGSNPSGGERMSGLIYRVSVYGQALDDAAILRHAKGFTDVLQPPTILSFAADPVHVHAGESATLSWSAEHFKALTLNGAEVSKVVSFAVSPEVTTTYRLVASSPNGSFESTVTVYVDPKLDAYDASIAADQTAGLIPVARLTTPAVLTGFGGAAFNFGEVPGDAVMEFIVEGDPWNAVNAFLAVGENTTSSLRFEQWENTAQYGFTRNTIKDYLFTPPVPSSAWPTHLAFAWDSAGAVMNLYVNGSLAGTTTEVSPLFSMPTGQGFLGANEAGGEALMGTIFRVTVYDSLISEEAIRRHASAFLAEDRPALNAYDEAIRAGVIAPVARLFAPVVLPGLGGMPFDFGTVTSAGSLEFIVEGDPDRSTSSSLAAGKNSESMLRYEVWDDTTEVGFTLAAVADYQFTPGVASPRDPTHLVYTWLPDQGVMQVFVDGQLAGTTTKVDPGFGLPLGLGMLGANTDGGEPMAGTILRVTAYDTVLTEGEILSHARAFHPAAVPPVLSILVVGGEARIHLTEGVVDGHYRIEYRDSLAAGGSWNQLMDIAHLPGTQATLADPTPVTGRAQRYYRALLLR